MTYFWLDTWLTPRPLSTVYPCLYSHSTGPFVRVANIMRFGIDFNLRDRLISAAVAELSSLLSLLQDFMLSDEQDSRFLNGGHPFSTKKAYKLLTQGADEDTNAKIFWPTRVPNKIKVFAWLAFKGRLNTKANLARKTITPTATCPRCSLQDEDTDHLFLHCPLAVRIWQCCGIGIHALSYIYSGTMPHYQRIWTRLPGPSSSWQSCGAFGMPGMSRPSTPSTFTPLCHLT